MTNEMRAMIEGALIAGLSLSDVASKYGVNRATVGRVKVKLEQRLNEEGKPKVIVDEMLQQSLQTHLQAINAIAEVAKDKDWLRTQRGNDLSALHNTLEAHVIRLLQSCEPDAGEDG